MARVSRQTVNQVHLRTQLNCEMNYSFQSSSFFVHPKDWCFEPIVREGDSTTQLYGRLSALQPRRMTASMSRSDTQVMCVGDSNDVVTMEMVIR